MMTENVERERHETPLWFRENRLPTTVEISHLKNKFPTLTEETKLRELFFSNFFPQIRPFLEQLVEGNTRLSHALEDIFVGVSKGELKKDISEFGENEHTLLTAYFYGIYFYNYISSGRVFSPDLSYEQKQKAEKKARASMPTDITDSLDEYSYVREHTPHALDVNNLADWPLRRGSAMLNPGAAAAAGGTIPRIHIFLERIHSEDPHKPKKLMIKQGTGLLKRNGRIAYETTLLSEWIRTGMEEACHIDFKFLREKRYEAKTGKSTYGVPEEEFYRGPLKSLIERKDVWKEIQTQSHPDAKLRYNALLDDEFAAHVVQAQYTKSYDPTTWERGYDEYDQAIRQTRSNSTDTKF